MLRGPRPGTSSGRVFRVATAKPRCPKGLRALRDEEVASYLRANPGFLAERPEIYGALTPPARRHGGVADHMAAMVQAGRHEVARVLEAGRARLGLGARVDEAVLALLRTQAPFDCVAEEWPALLAMETVRLLAEGEPRRHLVTLRAGEAARLLPATASRCGPPAAARACMAKRRRW